MIFISHLLLTELWVVGCVLWWGVVGDCPMPRHHHPRTASVPLSKELSRQSVLQPKGYLFRLIIVTPIQNPKSEETQKKEEEWG